MMEVASLQLLLNKIDSFLQFTSSCASFDVESLMQYYLNMEESLVSLRPVLDAIVKTDIASDDLLSRACLQLCQSVDESFDLFKNWHPLASRLAFVLEAESLITKFRSCALDILQILNYPHETLPHGLSTASLEECTRKVESIVCDQAEALISEAAGQGLSPDRLLEIAEFLGIKSNQEIFIEAVALEKLKENAEQAEKKADMEHFDQLIALIMQLHDCLFMIKNSQNSTPVPIPADLCCPLSLDLMTDPVIVSSGQTYERVYISNWLDLGLNFCPKTRQPLSRTNLTANYTVKALIARWCEQNNVQLPDPVKSVSLNQPLAFIPPTGEQVGVDRRRASLSPQIQRVGMEGSLETERISLRDQPSFTDEKCLHPNGYDSLSSSTEIIANDVGSREQLAPVHIRTTSKNGTRSRDGTMLHPSAMECRVNLSNVENHVKSLVEDLKSSSVDRTRKAAAELRVLAKQNMENRVIIANCGAISLLVKALNSTDTVTQEICVTTLLNLSLSDNNKAAIANAGAIEPLIHVLKTGSPEAKGNAAATLFSISVIEENKLKIGRSGAIGPLVELLAKGNLSAKKDATTALYNLSILHENKTKIVEAGAIKYLIELMDPGAGMVDKAVAALANLATIPEGKNDIGGLGGIPVLVEVVELGSARGKENAAAALVQLCTNNPKFCNMALQEGVVPPMVALSQSGTARGKEKAQALLNCFRNQRQGNLGRE